MIWLWNPTLLKNIYLEDIYNKNGNHTFPTVRGPHPTATTSPSAPSQVNDNNNHRRWPTAARCLPEHQANEWVGLTCLILTSVGNLLSCELSRQAGHLRFEMWLLDPEIRDRLQLSWNVMRIYYGQTMPMHGMAFNCTKPCNYLVGEVIEPARATACTNSLLKASEQKAVTLSSLTKRKSCDPILFLQRWTWGSWKNIWREEPWLMTCSFPSDCVLVNWKLASLGKPSYWLSQCAKNLIIGVCQGLGLCKKIPISSVS